MSYVALYRKFRPRTFDEVRGQDAIVTTLRNQVRADRTQHAYLFCGTRGTGKTTVAKILARAVNCDAPVNGNPCGECETCRRIAAGKALNVIEIDAASNNGVDSIREIIDEVQYRPPSGRYKVYIIDEVHMLSTGAFNALLKTLEEPPAYVMFILATTEPNKIPITILSRCQRYDFRRIDTPTIAAHLSELTKKENSPTEPEALHYIARAADGSMRDALSLLDQCLAFQTGDILTYEQVLDVLGVADTTVFDGLLAGILKGDAGETLRIYEKMIDSGRENGQFITDFVWYLRNILMVRASGDGRAPVDVSEERMAELKKIAATVQEETLIRYIRVLSDLGNQLRYAANKRVLTEIALIRLNRPQMSSGDGALSERIRMMEEKIEELASRSFAAQPVSPQPEEMPEETEEPEEDIFPAAPQELKEIAASWDRILSEAAKSSKAFALTTRMYGRLSYKPEEKEPVLYVGYTDKKMMEGFFKPSKPGNDDDNKPDVREKFGNLLRQVIRRLFKRDVQVEFYFTDENKPELRLLTVDEGLKQIHMPIEIEN